MLRTTALRRALAGAAALVLIPLTAGTASAATLSLYDGTGDVKKMDLTGNTAPLGNGFVAAPDQRDGDVVRTVFKHSPRKLTIHTRFAELNRTGTGFMMMVRLRTDEGVRRILELDAGPAGSFLAPSWHGRLSMMKAGNGDPVRCAGWTRAIDYDANTVTITIPRSCVSWPKWVQFTQMSMRMTSTSDVFIDNPHNHRAMALGWTDQLRRG